MKECKAPVGGQSTPKSSGRPPLGASDTGATSTTTSPTETSVRRVNFENVPEAQIKMMKVLQKVQQLEATLTDIRRDLVGCMGAQRCVAHVSRIATVA